MASHPDVPPPQNLDAEQAVLGACMVEPDLIPVVAGVLDVKDFYAPHNGAIFSVLVRLKAADVPINKISVATTLRERNVLEAVGGPQYLTQLLDAVPTTASTMYYANLVSETSIQRHFMRSGQEVVKAGFEGQSSLELANIMTLALETAQTKWATEDGLTFPEALSEAMLSRPDRMTNGVPFGFQGLDQRLPRGMKPGQTTVLAARTSHGKSSIVEMLAVNTARLVPVLFFPLEMGRVETVDRIANRLDIRARMGDEHPFEGIDLRIYDNRKPWNVARIGAQVAKHKPLITIIDHLQWLTDWDESRGKNERSDAAPKRTIKALTRLAAELRTHIIEVHQINREGDGKPPRLRDLRDTGAVEDWAWQVIFLHRPNFENAKEDHEIHVIVAKARNGKPGRRIMAWDGPNQSVYDLPGKVDDQDAEPEAEAAPQSAEDRALQEELENV